MTTSAQPQPPAEADVLAMLSSLDNRGRWGDRDERGTLNFVTAEVVRRAAAAVRDGTPVSCALEIAPVSQPGDVLGPPQRLMARTGQPTQAVVAGSAIPPGARQNAAGEYLGFAVHGANLTHLDALCHTTWDGKVYNDAGGEPVSVEDGAVINSVTAAGDGVVTRGVLVDAARLRNVPWLAPGDAVGPDLLADFESATGLSVQSGDALLLRTGYGSYRREHGAVGLDASWAGWSAAVLPWLHDREVALLGSDGFNESLPNEYVDVRLPIHAVGQVAMGLWLLDNADLEALAEQCQHRQKWDFSFTVAPLRVRGGTGSPVNPIAVL